MGIILDEKKSLYTLQTRNSMYQMKVDALGVLLHTYYGKRTEPFDYSYLITYKDRGFAGNPYEVGRDKTYSLETLPQEYSCFGSGDYRASALKIRYHMGARALELRYVFHEVFPGKYALPGLPAIYANEGDKADTLVITLRDDVSGVYVQLFYGVMEELDVITRAVRIVNRASDSIYLERALSMCIDYQYGNYDLLTFYGKHLMERKLSRAHIHHGIQSVGSVRGTSSHHYNPFIILADRAATETQGECYGFSFLYSGNFLGEAEYDQVNQTRVLMGIHPDNFEFKLLPGEEFYTPEVAMVYSGDGFEPLSQTYHRVIRSNLCRGKYKDARRPVLINNWEGTYFDFTGEKLLAMAREAAGMGVELFVMDDGWFGKRDSDDSGLGDWVVNEKKLGCTLGELSDQIHALGMKFGIWFEPECVSEDSDLYRVHPDWAFRIPGRQPMRGRYQLVLDFSREDVRTHIYQMICDVLDSARIEYLKWDFNRSISDVYSAVLPADQQGKVAHQYVLGLYEMLEKLMSRYPDLLIEGCSGGGGRFDAGMLYYTPQIWCSDDTDAIERLKIHYGTSFCYPVSTMGAHVSACPNHQTGRITPLNTRATVAMSGTFGYELDPMKLSDEEKKEIRCQIDTFKKYYDLIQRGKYHRLTNPFVDEVYNAWEFAKDDGSEALLSVVATKIYANEAPVYIRLRGLKPEAYYMIEGKKYLGGALMYAGMRMPDAATEYQSWNFHITEIC